MNQSVNEIKFIPIAKFKISNSYIIYLEAHSPIIISRFLESVCLCQSDPIKQLPLLRVQGVRTGVRHKTQNRELPKHSLIKMK